jgi:hypothetical protein
MDVPEVKPVELTAEEADLRRQMRRSSRREAVIRANMQRDCSGPYIAARQSLKCVWSKQISQSQEAVAINPILTG